MFYITRVQVFFFFCTRDDYYIVLSFLFYLILFLFCLHLPAGQHGKSKHNNSVCEVHYRRDLMISRITCGEKIYISVSIICQMSWRILAKNQILCIPSLHHNMSTCLKPNANQTLLLTMFW